MAIHIDQVYAEKVLKDAYDIASDQNFKPDSEFTNQISEVINHTHLTFKYIFVTALLSKCVDPDVNPLALQAGSKLPGSYDARSVCHSVVVPFERIFLSNGLGGSNEPFLNKPARFTEISRNNAVRRGKDKAIQDLLCTLLPKIKNQKQSFNCLVDALYFILKNAISKSVFLENQGLLNISASEILQFIDELTAKSFEGESCVLVAGALIQCLGSTFYKGFNVNVHPVNQAGSSSNEVNDIDAYNDKGIVWTFEIKDKNFTRYDVDHAVRKTRENHCSSLYFIKGKNGSLIEMDERTLILEHRSNGFLLNIIGIVEFSELILGLTENASIDDFVGNLLKNARDARVKDQTLIHLKETLQKYNMIGSN